MTITHLATAVFCPTAAVVTNCTMQYERDTAIQEAATRLIATSAEEFVSAINSFGIALSPQPT